MQSPHQLDFAMMKWRQRDVGKTKGVRYEYSPGSYWPGCGLAGIVLVSNFSFLVLPGE